MKKEDIQALLEHIGFTRSETAVYLALLELGSTTTGPLIKEAKIPQGKVYVLLNKLIDKGVVTHTIKRGTKYFQAKDPQTILDWFERIEGELADKKRRLIELLPELKAKHESSKYEKQVEIYEGFKGMKTLYQLLLTKGKKMDIIGTTSSIPQVIENYFLKWHKERIVNKIHIKFIYSKERKRYASNREKMPYTEVKYLNLPISPTWTTIIEDYVISVTMIDEHNITCFLIKDKNVANAQREYFHALWKQAEK